MMKTALVLLCFVGFALAQETPPCVLAGRPVLSSCSDQISHIQTVYILGSDTPITDQEKEKLRSSQPSGVPSADCCKVLETFISDGCACDASLPNALAGIGLSISQTGLISAVGYTAEQCNHSPPSC